MRIDRCTAQRRDGSFCDAPSVEGAPFPICHQHIRAVMRWEGRESDPTRLQQVYYVLTPEGHVKIGTTGDRVSVRLNSQGLRARDVLTTETGGPPLESARHQQFRHLLVPGRGREIFYLAPELESHIAMLLSHHGPPVLDGYRPEIVEYLSRGSLSLPHVDETSTRREVDTALRLYLAHRAQLAEAARVRQDRPPQSEAPDVAP